MKLDKKQVTLFLTTLTLVAIVTGVALSVYAADNGDENSTSFAEWNNGRMMMARPHNGAFGRPHGCRTYGLIEVSEEFEESIVSIAESDLDVQALLDDGYNITQVKPIIKTVVEADGSIETRATDAIVMLKSDETGHAAVWVDLEDAKVTEIVIITRTVIEKA